MGCDVNIVDVIKHFSDIGAGPIDVEDDVLPFLRANGVADVITIFEVDIESRYLKGKLAHWEPWEYQDDWALDFERPRCCADIYVAKELSHRWRRLIEAKELLHILDPIQNRVSTAAEVESLADKIRLPIEAETFAASGHKTITDALGLFEALAVLFPYKVRETLMEKFTSKALTVEAIADYMDLPEEYAYLVMSDLWETIYPILARHGT